MHLIQEYQDIAKLGKESGRARSGSEPSGPSGGHGGDGPHLPGLGHACLQAAAGFRGSDVATDPETGIGISVTMWETEADREAVEASGYYKEQIAKLADFLVETPI